MSYFDWLVMTVAPHYYQREKYSELLFVLYRTEFYWTIARDRNRAIDGLDLRGKYERDTGEYCDAEGGCSVLEMLIALAIRCEKELMYDPELGDRTDLWFWMMIENLGLDEFDSGIYEDSPAFFEEEIQYILERFMDRKYGKNGEFCAFPISFFDPNFRKMELAYQLNYFIKEKFY